MTSLGILKRKLENIARNPQAVGSDHQRRLTQLRVKLVTDNYLKGGKSALKRIKQFGVTERGSPVKPLPSFEELLIVICDLRLAKVYTTGPSQCGKTLSHILFLVDSVACCKLNVGWFYQSLTSLNQNVPRQFRPVANAWVAKMKEHRIRVYAGRTNLNSNYQIDNANAVFSYVSTSRPELRKAVGGPAAAGAAVSVQLDLLILEERSQYEPGSADSLPRRLDASCLPNRIIRELGTPGCGNGIEANLHDVDYYFYPHYTCENCGKTLPLDPKGCLLQKDWVQDATGRKKLSYFSESGRPIKWFSKESGANAQKTAYFACSHCHHPLSDELRYDARFYCKKTGVTVAHFLRSLPPGIPKEPLKVAMHLSPLTRRTEFNLAAAMIDEGMGCVFADDWQQQMMGHVSERGTSQISLELLKEAIYAPRPDNDIEPNFRIAGIDEGRSEDWLMIVDFYLPANYYQLHPVEIIEQTIRVVRFGKDVVRDDIPDLLGRFYVEYGFIDNEPSRESAMRLCRKTCLEMANQVDGQRSPLKETTTKDGGIEYSCWDLRNEKFMNTVLEGFLLQATDGYPLYRLPPEWEKWIGDRSSKNPLVHLSGPHRDTSGRWHRGRDNLDDLYMALLFAEAAFYRCLENQQYYGGGDSVSGTSPVRNFASNLD